MTCIFSAGHLFGEKEIYLSGIKGYLYIFLSVR